MQKIKIPTGYLLVDDYSRGKLETLSIGDYGKHRNIKAEFLGYMNEINGVANGPCLPMSEKWVVTLSTQFGCPMHCLYCDCPSLKFNGNVSYDDLLKQFRNAISVFPDVRYAERLNIHFARMGEPMFNFDNVLLFSEFIGSVTGKRWIQNDLNLRSEVIHPVFTTSMPRKAKNVKEKLLKWCDIKNNLFRGQAGLQISVNSTDPVQRHQLFGGDSMSLVEIAEICRELPEPVGRKYCLNFAFSSDTVIDGLVIKQLFDPEYFMCKITPIHESSASVRNGIKTVDGYHSYVPYRDVERNLIDAGFDVLVFIPSTDEEHALVTCGNSLLAGSEFRTDVEIQEI